MNLTKLSKFLSLVLRHDPNKIGLELDPEGWAEVDDLLSCLGRAGRITSREELDQVVAENNKQRFRFSDDGQFLRANQGHSIPIELGLEPTEPPGILYHGTATRFLESIREQELVKGGRQHVHLSAEPATAHAVGSRHGRPVVLVVHAARMQRKGFEFFLSDNGVWLVNRVPREDLEEPI
jgi:putative RNA 2'-phosphotransferase